MRSIPCRPRRGTPSRRRRPAVARTPTRVGPSGSAPVSRRASTRPTSTARTRSSCAAPTRAGRRCRGRARRARRPADRNGGRAPPTWMPSHARRSRRAGPQCRPAAPALARAHARRGSAARSSEHHRNRGGAALVHADDLGRLFVGVESEVRQAIEERVDRDGHLRARDVHAEADVRSPAERERGLQRRG